MCHCHVTAFSDCGIAQFGRNVRQLGDVWGAVGQSVSADWRLTAPCLISESVGSCLYGRGCFKQSVRIWLDKFEAFGSARWCCHLLNARLWEHGCSCAYCCCWKQSAADPLVVDPLTPFMACITALSTVQCNVNVTSVRNKVQHALAQQHY